MKFLLELVLLLSFLLSCTNNNNKHEPIDDNFIETGIDIILAQKDNNTVELLSYHNSGVYISSTKDNEPTILLKTLTKRGFKTISYKQGKIPPDGPIIISTILEKDKCICQVEKLIYSTAAVQGYEVSERIKCADSLTFFR